MNLRKFDLNLLVIFQTIIAEKSVVAAAEQIGLSPSAVSHALARLRVMFNDELFRRTSRGLEPTERALALASEIEIGLAHIGHAIEGQHVFDPASAKRLFTMQIADYVSGILLAPLAKRLQTDAPGISVEVLPFSMGTETERLTADVQIRFTPGQKAPAALRVERLITDKFMVVMRPGHPAAGAKLTPESYASLSHVRLSPSAIGTMMVDEALSRRGLKRRIVMSVPSWFDLPQIVENSDLVAIVPSRLSLTNKRLAGLHAAELPLSEVKFAIDLSWDARRDHDPGQRWFRELLKTILRGAKPQ
jgi:DNA-binding transcriptional LysR family regulator